MPTVNEFWKVAAQVASERGGLVVGFTKDAEQPEVGSRLDKVLGFTALAPVTVSSKSDWADWVEQVEAFYRVKPDWGRGKRGSAEARYYRVRFDAKFDSDSNAESNFDSSSDSHSDLNLNGKFDQLSASPRPTSLFNRSAPSSSLSIPSFGGYAEPINGFQGVHFWPRALARAIDFVVHYVAALLAGMLFAFILTVAAGGRPPDWVLLRIFQHHFTDYIAAFLGLVAYSVICDSVSGSTLGKRVLSMQVVQEDGSPCRVKSALIREAAYIGDALFLGLVAYFAMRDDTKQQRLGDQWAHTVVCKRAQVPIASQQVGMRFVLGFLVAIAADIAVLMTGWLIKMSF
jgi:uncharacterized RDD family membrane protein YckC